MLQISMLSTTGHTLLKSSAGHPLSCKTWYARCNGVNNPRRQFYIPRCSGTTCILRTMCTRLHSYTVISHCSNLYHSIHKIVIYCQHYQPSIQHRGVFESHKDIVLNHTPYALCRNSTSHDHSLPYWYYNLYS